MLPRKMVIVGLFCCWIRTGATRCRSKALFPVASRTKRAAVAAPAMNPTFHSSFDDVHLLFEILMSGIHFDGGGAFSVQDAELASLRKTRNLDAICEEIIPKKITDIFRLLSNLSSYTCRLHQEDFERTLMTLVYAAQRAVGSGAEHQKDVWAESFVKLYKAIKKDLTAK
ncbi:unnamed protein product [Ophioblennius macclurei]